MQTHTEETTRTPRTRFRDGIDFNRLPPEAFLKISDVMIVTAMSRSTLEKRVASDEFPAPRFCGRDRVWPWGEVREWLLLAGEKEEF